MQSQVTTIQILLAGGNSFTIPIYQRRYAWSTESALDLLSSLRNTPTSNPVIFGAITCVTHGFGRHIVDGQQRLTTITLIIAAIKEYFSDRSEHRELIPQANACIFMAFAPENNKITLKSEDNQIYSAILRENGIPINTPDDHKIKNNYLAIREAIQNLAPHEVYSVFQNTMTAQIVEILVSNNENPQKIFEALNSKGQDLTKIDLITNLLFMDMPPHLQENAYKLTWSAIENRLSSDELAIDFLRSFLAINLERTENLAAKNLYAIFKSEYFSRIKKDSNIDQDSRITAIGEINKFFQAYEIVTGHAHDTDPEITECLSSIRKLNIAQSNTLLTFLQAERSEKLLTTQQFVNIIKIIESYIARRSLIQLSSAGLFRILTKLAIKLKRGQNQNNYLQATIKYFANLDPNTRFPRDNEIIEELKVANFYAYNSTSKMLFFSEIIKQEYPKFKIEINDATLEHIMPQTLNLEWRRFLGNDAEIFHKKYLHTIGNLTIIPKELNSSLGQSSLSKKIEILKNGIENDNSRQEPPPYQNIFQKIYSTGGTNWNVDSVENNAKYYLNSILKSYPEPDEFDSFIESTEPEFTTVDLSVIRQRLSNEERINVYRSIEKIFTENKFLPVVLTNCIQFEASGDNRTAASVHTTYGQNNIRIMLDVEEGGAIPGTQIGGFIDNLKLNLGDFVDWIDNPGNGAAGALKIVANSGNIEILLSLIETYAQIYRSN
jgi:uncharacterized protein with ParB-like and HNH nuclease domain